MVYIVSDLAENRKTARFAGHSGFYVGAMYKLAAEKSSSRAISNHVSGHDAQIVYEMQLSV